MKADSRGRNITAKKCGAKGNNGNIEFNIKTAREAKINLTWSYSYQNM